MDPQELNEDGGGGLDRRTVIRRGAIFGGALVWTTPVVQSIAGPAFANGTPCVPEAIVGIHFGNQYVCVGTYTFVGNQCCSCVMDNGSNADAVALCRGSGKCQDLFAPGVC